MAGVMKVKIAGDPSSLQSAVQDSVGGFSKLKAAALATATALGATLWKSVSDAMDIEAGSDKLAAQLALTAVESERLGGVAGRLYADAYGGSMEEVNTAIGAVVSSMKGMRNASAADVEAMTAKVLDFSSAFEVDVTRAAQVAGQMITSGLAQNGTHAMDLLFASMQKIPAAVRDDLMDAIDEYGPFMEAVGIRGEQAMGVLVKASEKGMFGIDKAGDAIKEFGIRATDMSKASATGFDALGMSQEEMAGKLLKGGDVAKDAFNKIVTGLLSIEDPTKQSTAAIALFGTPLEDLSVSEIPKFLKSLTSAETALGDVSGAADSAGQTLNDNARTNITSFGRQLQLALVDVIGNKVLPAVSALASFMAENFGPALSVATAIISNTVIPALKLLVSAVDSTPFKIVAGVIAAILIPHYVALGVAATISGAKTAAVWIGLKLLAIQSAVAHSVAVVGMVAKWVALGAAALLHGAKVAAAWLLTAGTSMATAIGAMIATAVVMVAKWVMMGAAAMAQAIRMAAAWFIAMGPVGWVIGVIVGLVALIIANWDTIKRVTIAVWNAVWKWVSDIMTKIRNWVNQRVLDVIRFFDKLSQVKAKVMAWFGRAKDAAIRKMVELINWVRGIPGRILGAIGNLGSLLFQKGKDIVQGLINGVTSMIGNIGKAIGGVASKIASFLPGSPVKEGPLTVLNRGYAGGQITKMLAGGIDGGLSNVVKSADRVARAGRASLENLMAQAETEAQLTLQTAVRGTGPSGAPVPPPPVIGTGQSTVRVTVDGSRASALEEAIIKMLRVRVDEDSSTSVEEFFARR